MNARPHSRIIRHVRMFTPFGMIEGDCLIEDGRIAELGALTTSRVNEEIDGKGLWLWPGAFDAHVHMRAPGSTHKEDWYTGSRAAASGGVTCAFDMPNTTPSATTVARFEQKRALVASTSIIPFGLFFGANPENLNEALDAKNCAGLKIFMASSTGDLLVDKEADLERIFAAYDRRICVHAESEERLIARDALFAHREHVQVHSVVRDPTAAKLGIEMATRLANRHGRQLHVLHVSTADELVALCEAREIANAHNTGARISAEACPHHLFMNVDAYNDWGCHVQMNPPLRMESDRQAVWKGLDQGVLQMIATDHAPHLREEKALPYRSAPSGVPGIETMLPLMLDAAHRRLCTHEQVLEWVCHAPSRIYNVQDRGQLRVGFHADVVLIDPFMQRTIVHQEQRSKCGWTPWHGRKTVGWPVRTLVAGQDVFVREGAGPGHIVSDAAVGEDVVFL